MATAYYYEYDCRPDLPHGPWRQNGMCLGIDQLFEDNATRQNLIVKRVASHTGNECVSCGCEIPVNAKACSMSCSYEQYN